MAPKRTDVVTEMTDRNDVSQGSFCHYVYISVMISQKKAYQENTYRGIRLSIRRGCIRTTSLAIHPLDLGDSRDVMSPVICSSIQNIFTESPQDCKYLWWAPETQRHQIGCNVDSQGIHWPMGQTDVKHV